MPHSASFAIDLDRLCRDRPALVHSLFLELVEYFKNGTLKSLMVLELKQRLETGLDVELSIDRLMQYPSLVNLSAQLLAQLETSQAR